ncbi:Mitochondrial import inner membrane translocase subunit Tim17/Tim22/Tim23 family protein [Zea mays]|uniref:Complex I assembly factor TIMMDC1, mitochondrial n=1 Tax=Zea mays TaxID=4577 RepID=A0A1D6FBB7_MAIZE|nr:Mitochondrial import inner membrane translocase subunit Tim17/Tim22/Tim23 family protein [Zea mays]AQK89340.1 Mitochondrial import inner membrane translocase subunit Tim17/Tim22/Tim23 family protein [Zea mays]
MPASAAPPAQPAAPPPPPPPASPAPPEDVEATAGSPSRASAVGTVNWGTATLVGVFAGLLYGGSREASASVSKDAEVMLKMGSTTDKREQYRLMRDAMEKRFIRVAKGSLVGGVRLGMFTATFFGIQNLLIDTRGVHDVFNIAAAGSATAAAFGLICWVQLKLAEKANLEIANSKPSSDLTEGKENQSRVGAAIERLEGSLKK